MRIAITPDGRRVAFPVFEDDAVQIADVETRAVTHTIAVGRRPAGTTMSADGRVLFVSCEDERRVYVVDLAHAEVVAEIGTGEGPDAMVALDLAELA